jgi:mannitol-1-phosphate 5-dehydrogenase
MKKAVMYGAGNIGRGFIGQLLYESGYSTTFIDINEKVINALNKDGKYPVKIVSNEFTKELFIENVCGVQGTNTDEVAGAISECDIMFTAVGVNVLPLIASNIANGIAKRAGSQRELNIIICENKVNADLYLKNMVIENIEPEYHNFVNEKVGFIEASVGRMVPVVTESMREGNILKVWVEPFCKLPVDKDAFKGEIPEISGMILEGNFEYHIQSKLYLHNMGHSMTAYLGKLNGYKYIFEAIENENIRYMVKNAMYSSAEALSLEHNKRYTDVKRYADDLIHRFGNRHLGDTVARVGKDINRKLGENDRFMGAIRLCEKHGIDSIYIKIAVASALLFGEKYGAENIKLGEPND